MLRTLLTLALAGAISHAYAEDCHPFAEAQKRIEAAGGGKFKPLSHNQLNFARGLYVMTPPTSTYPPGDEAVISEFKGGGAVVLFVSGDKSCGQAGFGPDIAKMLFEIDKSI